MTKPIKIALAFNLQLERWFQTMQNAVIQLLPRLIGAWIRGGRAKYEFRWH